MSDTEFAQLEKAGYQERARQSLEHLRSTGTDIPYHREIIRNALSRNVSAHDIGMTAEEGAAFGIVS